MTQRPPFRRRLPRLGSAMLAAGLFGWSAAQAPLATAQELGKSPALSSKTPVTLNFVNADIEAVTRAMAVMLDRQILVDPRVKGAITLYSDQPLLVRDAYLNYLAALRGMGFTVVETGGLLKVVPEADAKLQTGTVSVGEVGRRGDQIITQIFTLRHESANNLVAVLRPLISPNNTINANAASNSLVITDYADNLTRLGKIIASMDTPSQTDVEVYPLQHAVAVDLAPMLQKLVDGSSGGAAGGAQGGAPVPTAAGGAGGVSILTDVRSNALVVRTPNPQRMSLVRSLIDKLDRPNATGGPAGNIYVVHLRNADAVRLATVLRAAYTAGLSNNQQGGGGGLAGLTGGGGGNTAPTTAGTPTSPGATGASPQATAPVNAAAAPSTGGFVQADPATNSLIITAPEPMYRQLRQMIEQLDSRRAQVYIESMIVEVSGDNAADFGFQWQGLLGQNGDTWGLAGGTNFSNGGNILDLTAAALGGTSTGTSTSGTSSTSATTVSSLLGNGLNVALIRDFGGTYGLAAIARFLQTQTNTNIVSTPNLITLDNEEAKIIVGSNVPFITGQFTATGTATTNPFQTIERKDVGITLRIKPQIGENGAVKMVLFQESSSVSSQVAPGTSNAGPTTDKRSIESTIVVDDGQIIVLGGLIEDRYTDSRSKVPLLGDIPYLGALFRSESRTKKRTNLMVFLRPVVMRDAEQSNRVSLDRYDLIRSQQRDAQPQHNALLPIEETPVLPPLRAVEQTTLPLAVPPSSPGSAAPGPTPVPAN